MITRYKSLLTALAIIVLALTGTATSYAQDDESDIVSEADIERPDWQLTELVDARTGESFNLGDFYGKAVLVEPMATWCTTCRSQMRNIVTAINELEAQNSPLLDDIIIIGLSVETNLARNQLASYAENQGFDWTFAVLSADHLGQLVNTFGRPVLNPPATPKFFIRPDGTYTELTTGIKSSAEIITLFEQAIAQSAPTQIIEADDAPSMQMSQDTSHTCMTVWCRLQRTLEAQRASNEGQNAP